MRGLGSAALVAVLLIAVAGCRSDSADVDAGPEPVELPGPGTPLDDGFTVVAGARLLLLDGTAGASSRDLPLESWSASLDVIGDPLEVYDASVEQVLATGFTITRGRRGCSSQYLAPTGGESSGRYLSSREPAPPGMRLVSITCDLSARRAVDERLSLWVNWVAEGAPTIVSNSAGLAYERWAPGTLHEQRPVERVVRYPSLPDGSIDRGEPAELPRTGEPLGDHPVAARVTIAVGTQLVVPVMDACAPGFSAYLAVTGDPDRAFVDYRRQLRDPAESDSENGRDSVRVGDHHLRIRRWSQYGASVELVRGMPGGLTMLSVSYCEG